MLFPFIFTVYSLSPIGINERIIIRLKAENKKGNVPFLYISTLQGPVHSLIRFRKYCGWLRVYVHKHKHYMYVHQVNINSKYIIQPFDCCCLCCYHRKCFMYRPLYYIIYEEMIFLDNIMFRFYSKT